MKYNERIKIIGERIKQAREEKGMSQSELITQLQNRMDGSSIGRNTLSKLENGNVSNIQSHLKTLFAIGEILDLDINHLIGEQEHTSLDRVDISKYTGLSDKAITILHDSISTFDRLPSTFLNDLIETPSFWRMAYQYGQILERQKRYNNRKSEFKTISDFITAEASKALFNEIEDSYQDLRDISQLFSEESHEQQLRDDLDFEEYKLQKMLLDFFHRTEDKK